MGGIGIWQLLIVLVIVIVIFGTKKLRNMGGDLGGAIRNFRQSMKDEGESKEEAATAGDEKTESLEERVIEGEVTSKEEHKDKV